MSAIETHPPETLYHYTDFHGFKGIVEGQAMWATDLRFTNDSNELKLGISWALEYLSEQCSPDDEIVKKVRDWLRDHALHQICVFSISFSTERNLMSQWRMYTKEFHGVCMGFKSASLQKLLAASNFTFIKCVYEHAAQKGLAIAAAQTMVDEVRSMLAQPALATNPWAVLNTCADKFMTSIAQIKDYSFFQENEYRLVRAQSADSKEEVKIRSTDKGLVPYLVFSLKNEDDRPKDMYKDFVINPGDGELRIAYCMRVLLERHAIGGHFIQCFGVPVRL